MLFGARFCQLQQSRISGHIKLLPNYLHFGLRRVSRAGRVSFLFPIMLAPQQLLLLTQKFLFQIEFFLRCFAQRGQC